VERGIQKQTTGALHIPEGNASAAGDSEDAFAAQLEEAQRTAKEIRQKGNSRPKQQELAEADAEYEAVMKKKREVEEIYKRFTPEEIAEARRIVEEMDAMNEREQRYKDDAEAELEALRQELKEYENAEEITEEQLIEWNKK
ncbi:hypothetical protein COOONC_06725, partial [Cooperia oncophora]